MKKYCLLSIFMMVALSVAAQEMNRIINTAEVEKIEQVLAGDALQGRLPGTPGAEKAAAFIAAGFQQAGVQPFGSSQGYLQRFAMVQPSFVSATCTMDETPVEEKNVIAITPQPNLEVTEHSGYTKIIIGEKDNLYAVVSKLMRTDKNYLVLVNPALATGFSRLLRLKRMLFESAGSLICVLTAQDPSTYTIAVKHTVKKLPLSNVVGVLPGKSRKNEYVVFSAHFDHLGIAKQPENGDSIYNGANDDAAGTTAVLLLARYFQALHNNERTIIFAAFTAEESGGYGSQYFSKQLDPAKVAAMFNIEMIGTASKWGKNSAYITGYEKSDMGKILEKNLQGSVFRFYPDPYPEQQLFYRSDNATLAQLGVPAHTISTSKMDNEPNYHRVSDEISTLDMANMAQIIQSIAMSAVSIVQGKDTPTRVLIAGLK